MDNETALEIPLKEDIERSIVEKLHAEAMANAAKAKAAQKAKPIELPDFAVFRNGETIPMRGWNFKFMGYANPPGFQMIFECVGKTGKAIKAEAKAKKKKGGR